MIDAIYLQSGREILDDSLNVSECFVSPPLHVDFHFAAEPVDPIFRVVDEISQRLSRHTFFLISTQKFNELFYSVFSHRQVSLQLFKSFCSPSRFAADRFERLLMRIVTRPSRRSTMQSSTTRNGHRPILLSLVILLKVLPPAKSRQRRRPPSLSTKVWIIQQNRANRS